MADRSSTEDSTVEQSRSGSGGTSWYRGRGGDVVVAVGIAVVCVLAVLAHVKAYEPLSPLDELQIIDYVEKVADGHVPRQGELIGEEAMRIQACRGLDWAHDTPACDAALEPTDFQEEGYNTSLGHSPLYFWSTGVLRGLFDPFMDGDGVDATRMVGSLWLAAGAALVYGALRLVGLRRVYATVLALASALAPGTMHAAAAVNNDVGLYTAGAAMLVLVVAWLRRDVQPVPWRDPLLAGLIAVAVVGTLLKASVYLGAMFVAAVVLLPWARLALRWVREKVTGGAGPGPGAEAEQTPEPASEPAPEDVAGTEAARRSWLVSGLVVAAAVLLACALTSTVWKAVMDARAIMPVGEIPMFARYHVDSLQLRHFAEQYFAVIPPLHPTFVPPVFAKPILTAAIDLASAFQLAVIFLPIFGLAGRVTRRWAGLFIGLAIVLAVSGPTLVVLNYLALENYQGIPFRYGLALVPAVVCCVGLANRHKAYQWASGAILAAPALIFMAAVLRTL